MARLEVKSETDTGLNTRFHDNYLGIDITLNQAIKKVEAGVYDDYHVRTVKKTGQKFIASNPDKSKKNNLEK